MAPSGQGYTRMPQIFSSPSTARQSRLLDQVRAAIHTKYYSRSTEKGLDAAFGSVFLPCVLEKKYPNRRGATRCVIRLPSATHSLEDRYDMRTVQDLLGHSNAKTTMT